MLALLHRQQCLTRQHRHKYDPATQRCQQHHHESECHAQQQPHGRPDDGEEAIDTPRPWHQRCGFLGDHAQAQWEGQPEQDAERREPEERRQMRPPTSAQPLDLGLRVRSRASALLLASLDAASGEPPASVARVRQGAPTLPSVG